MPGFPLAAIGAGLGIWAKNMQEQQAQRERNAMLQMQLQRFQQEQQDRQKQQQLASAEWQSMLGDTGGSSVQPTPGGAAAVPPVGGGMPFAPPVPQPMSGRDLGGGLRAGGALTSGADIKQRESGGNYNVGYGGTDLSNAPLDQYGFPIWPGKMGPAGMSHAAGAYQFQPGTWRPYAQKLGIKDFSPASQDAVFEAAHAAEGDKPWAASAPRGGSPREQQMAQAGPQTATDAGSQDGGVPAMTDTQAGKQLDQMIPPTVHRKMSLNALVQQVAKIPGISDDVRAKLVEDRIKLLAPQEAEYAREYFDTQRAARSEAALDKRQEGMEKRASDREDALTKRQEAADKRKWGDPVKMEGPDGAQYVQVNKATGEVRPVQVPKGAELSKIGSRASSPMDEADAKYWAQVIAQGGSLPTGLRRSGVVEQVMKLVPGLAQGMTPGDFIAKHSEVKANTTSLTNLTKMADSAISFEKLAEKNFDVALRLAPNAVPTELGPFFNKWVEQGETALGDPSVPPYVAAIITGANEYAKVMSGSTGTAASTVDARREARELFSPYLSLPQISQVIAVAKADMKNRENTLTEQVASIKQRLGSSAPVTVAPPATPRATGQESQNMLPGTQPAQAGSAQIQEGQTGTMPDGKKWIYRGGKWEPMQ